MTHYEILGISESSSINEIKEAYRKRAIEYHPDINSSDNAKKIFILIRKSYEILSDPVKKSEYDRFLSWEKNLRGQSQVTTSKEINKKENVAPQSKEKGSNIGCILCLIVFVVILSIIYILDITNENSTSNSTPTKEYKNQGFGDTTIFVDAGGEVYHIELNDIERFFEVNPWSVKINELNPYNINEARKKALRNFYEDGAGDYTSPASGNSPYDSFFGKSVIAKGSLCRVTIKNGTSLDAVVLFKNINTDKVVRNIYVRADENYTVKEMPLGTYEMKCYYGNIWIKDLIQGDGKPDGGFLYDESYSAATSSDDYFIFEETRTKDGYNYNTYEVTLHKVRDGNMHTKEITSEYFFN